MVNVGRLCLDQSSMLPATPWGVWEIIKRTGWEYLISSLLFMISLIIFKWVPAQLFLYINSLTKSKHSFFVLQLCEKLKVIHCVHKMFTSLNA